MSDIYTLSFKNFRSIKDATVEIAPLTVIYGPNGAGKSSLIYGLLTLRNFLTNPNQYVPSLFSYPALSLGGLEEVVYDHRTHEGLSLSIGVGNADDLSTEFTLTLDPAGGTTGIAFQSSEEAAMALPENLEFTIALPYGVNQQATANIHVIDGYDEFPSVLTWNGVTVTAQVPRATVGYERAVQRFNQRANLPMVLAQQTGFIPVRRGFSKANYGLTSVTSALATEDEVASLLAMHSERHFRYKVNEYLARIAQRQVQITSQLGTSAFTLDSIPTEKGISTSIVNDGFGVNQILYLLTICLHSPYKIVTIEEPEIHLHPSLVRELARALIDIVANHDRRLIISTHSEGFVIALLAQIATGKLSVDDVSFLFAENQDGQSTFTKQEATPHGQIQGGLEAFMASELEDLAAFLGVDSPVEEVSNALAVE